MSQITNYASAKGDNTDPAQGTAIITVNPKPVLTVNKTVNKATVYPGQSIVYTITVFNNGPAMAESVNVTDNAPNGIVFDSNTQTDTGSITTNTLSQVVVALGDLMHGQTAKITIGAIVQ